MQLEEVEGVGEVREHMECFLGICGAPLHSVHVPVDRCELLLFLGLEVNVFMGRRVSFSLKKSLTFLEKRCSF